MQFAWSVSAHSRRRGRRAMAPAVLALALPLLYACERADAPAAAAPPAVPAEDRSVVRVPPGSPQLKQMRVEAVRTTTVPSDELVAPARVALNPNRVSHVVPQVQGRVTRVMTGLGDFVEQGQPVIELDSPDADAAVSAYLQAEATRRQSRAALTKAESDLARTADLYEHKAVAEKD